MSVSEEDAGNLLAFTMPISSCSAWGSKTTVKPRMSEQMLTTLLGENRPITPPDSPQCLLYSVVLAQPFVVFRST